jgi:type IV pilus assembly protein PilF
MLNLKLSLAWLLLAVGLTGCVTGSTGRQAPKSSDTEAAEINLQLGVGYFRQGDLQSAQAKLEKAVEQNPKLVPAHTALGLVYERLGDIEGAERLYRRAVEIAPRDPDALNSMGQFLCRQESRQPAALEYFDRALDISLSEQYSNKAMVYTNAGVCAERTDLERSENYLRAAVANDPRYAEALLQLADVSYQRGNYLPARAFVQRYLAAAPASPAALWLGLRVETALGDTGAADDYGARLKTDFPESVETRLVLERERDAG